MNIAHVIPSVQEEASGPTYSVSSLCRAMNEAGNTATIIATGKGGIDRDSRLRTFPRRRFLHGLGISPEMHRWLRDEVAANAVDILHNHSIWMMSNVYPGWVTKGRNVPLVVSPRGTFSKWAMRRSRTVKFLFWHSLQKRAIAHAAMFHATATSEYDDIRRLGFRQPVVVLPNGIDFPPSSAGMRRDEGKATLLFLSRVHPTKGLENLLQAWAALQHQHLQWKLRIVGPGEPSYLKKLGDLASSLGLERITFDGPLYGREKDQAYRSADLFVLPTHSENFGMAVAEALAVGCPVVTTKGAPWSGLVEHHAGWWIDIGVEPLRMALDEAMAKHAGDLAEMGARGRSWMERDFSWEQIAAQMIESYRWIREGGAQPDWIVND